MKIIFCLSILLFLNCQDKKNTAIKHKVNESSLEKSKIINHEPNGILFINENLSRKDTINFYNKDGSLWYKFTFFYDDSDGDFEYHNESFKPLAFHPDYFLLSLKTVKKLNNKYKVIVNEEKKLKKYINKKHFLTFTSIENYILSKVSSIEFDKKNNPILEKPHERSEKVLFEKNHKYIPNEISGNWLQVYWKRNKKNYGWVKWKENENIIIKLNHIM